jgi:alkylhydroperoxidase family enzyme
MMHDYTQADIDHQTRTMLDFVAQLTREPSSMKEANVEGLREVGFSDNNILSITLVTCLYNFMTRLADGLGVEFPERGQELVKGWLQSPAREQEWLFAPKSDD